MRGNIAQLMQQAQKMQENLQRAQEELANLEVTGSAGGGMVSVTLTGTKECRKVRIDPSVLSDPEMAEDLVAAAFNDASNKVDAESKAKMGAASAGMPIIDIGSGMTCAATGAAAASAASPRNGNALRPFMSSASFAGGTRKLGGISQAGDCGKSV